jgi:predicted dehydrogenase
MTPLRAAVIGTGLIGTHHARIYHEHPLSTLVAVCDIDADRAQAVAQSLGARAYTRFDELLAQEELDVVSVATPEQQRTAPALAAAELGLGLLLEKPLTPTLEETDALIANLEGRGAFAAVNFLLHAEPRYSSMKELVASGKVGRVVTYFARRRGTRLGIQKYAPWTDLLISTAIHDIEMMLAINPAPPERVFAEAVVRECAPYGSEDAVMALLRFADGAIGSIETSWVLPPLQPEPLDPAFHVVGDRGGIFLEGSSQGLRIVTNDSYYHPDMTHWPTLPLGIGGALKGSLDAFLKAYLAGEPPLVGLAQARRAQEVVAAMKRSIRGGVPVELPHS